MRRREPERLLREQEVSRKRLVAVALFALLAPLAIADFDTIRANPLDAPGAFVLGVLVGAMTGMGFVVRQRR